MTLEAIFSEIENPEFEFQLGLASGFGTFQMILESTKVYQELLKIVQDVSTAKTVTNHLFELLADRGDPDYAHRHDKSIAAYMLAVMEKHPRLLEDLLADDVDPSGLFWTRFAAEKLNEILTTLTASESSSAYVELPQGDLIVREYITDYQTQTARAEVRVTGSEKGHPDFKTRDNSNSASASINFNQVA